MHCEGKICKLLRNKTLDINFNISLWIFLKKSVPFSLETTPKIGADWGQNVKERLDNALGCKIQQQAIDKFNTFWLCKQRKLPTGVNIVNYTQCDLYHSFGRTRLLNQRYNPTQHVWNIFFPPCHDCGPYCLYNASMTVLSTFPPAKNSFATILVITFIS